MIAVIFEVEPREGAVERYLELAATLRPELEQVDGFISVERFASLTTPGKYLSLSIWRDEEAVMRWRRHAGHQSAQALGRAEIFRGYRLRVAAVLRDYGASEREQAPAQVAPTWGTAQTEPV